MLAQNLLLLFYRRSWTMYRILKIIKESYLQAFQQLLGNKLRSFLSLLGITIGIFCIISVQSAVDSLADNIKKSFEKLGNDVIYVDRQPWTEDPGENYYKYMKRPKLSYEDFKAVSEKSKLAEYASFSLFIGGKTVKYLSNSIERAFVFGASAQYAEMYKMQFDEGRYFSNEESKKGVDKCLIGNTIASELFPNMDPIGKDIKVLGRKLNIIGVIEKSGKDLVNPLNYDKCIIISFNLARKMVNTKSNGPFGTNLAVKAKDGVTLGQLTDEVTGIIRNSRGLRPMDSNNFAVNELSSLTNILNSFFGVLNLAGFVIGLFAILVGMFSVANIMFVSVKERTSIIGIKKAIGARQWIILLEFLIEAIVLCLIGGLIGLILVYSTMKILTSVLEFEMFLSFNNMLIGVGLSVVIGILAGLLPAWQAARMDPVVAMRG